MAALLQQGPLSVCINAVLLQFYHSGVWDPIVKCDPSGLDHGTHYLLCVITLLYL